MEPETKTETVTVVKKEKKKETTAETIRSFFFAILIALVFRSLAYEPFHIPSSSMYSTLHTGDYVFISKLSYGYSRYSFPFGFKFFEGRKFFTEPERGDVVVFRNTDDPKVDYIKRVIGLPGDQIQMRRSRLFINGEMVEQTRRGSILDEEGIVKLAVYEERLPGGRTHTVLNRTDHGPADNTPVYTVPAGHYFMMGDNRDNSEDSRYAFAPGFLTPTHLGVGFVPVENLVGRAELNLLSFDTSRPFWKIWEWPQAFRNDRWIKEIR